VMVIAQFLFPPVVPPVFPLPRFASSVPGRRVSPRVATGRWFGEFASATRK